MFAGDETPTVSRPSPIKVELKEKEKRIVFEVRKFNNVMYQTVQMCVNFVIYNKCLLLEEIELDVLGRRLPTYCNVSDCTNVC